MKQSIKIVTSFGGPCVYKQGIFADGTTTGKIQDVGQGKKQIMEELLDSLETGRDDVRNFIDSIL